MSTKILSLLKFDALSITALSFSFADAIDWGFKIVLMAGTIYLNYIKIKEAKKSKNQ